MEMTTIRISKINSELLKKIDRHKTADQVISMLLAERALNTIMGEV